jgi:hypothetical protein
MLLRVIFTVGFGVLIIRSAIRTVHQGKATLRGGYVVTRLNTPGWFWTSVIIQWMLAGVFLELGVYIIVKY